MNFKVEIGLKLGYISKSRDIAKSLDKISHFNGATIEYLLWQSSKLNAYKHTMHILHIFSKMYLNNKAVHTFTYITRLTLHNNKHLAFALVVICI